MSDGRPFTQAELVVRVDAPAETVWSLLSGPDIRDIVIGLYAREMVIDGTVMTTTLLDGGIVRERIQSVDPAARRLTYCVLDRGPFPYDDYTGEMQVRPLHAEHCEVRFACRYVPVGMPATDSNRIWREHNTAVMASVKDYLARSGRG